MATSKIHFSADAFGIGKMGGEAITDANAKNTTGFYYCNDQVANIPSGVTGNGMLMVVARSVNGIFQLYFDNSYAKIYKRAYTGSWSAWAEV